MAAITSAVVGGASAIYGASQSNKAGKQQAKSAGQAIDEQRRQFEITRADQAPWLKEGGNALGRLGRFSAGDMSDFTASPDYNFVRSEGQRDIGHSFAGRGGAFSGNALRALSEYNTNLASGEVDKWWNRQGGLAGVGHNAATNLGQFGAQTAGNVGNALMAQGDARASGVYNGANALLSGVSQGLNGYQYWRQPKRTGQMHSDNYGYTGGSSRGWA